MNFAAGGLFVKETSLAELKTAWQEREAEARVLAALNQEFTAAGLRVYALEIKLEVVICRTLNLLHLPNECKSHDLDKLLVFAGWFSEPADPSALALKANRDKLSNFSRTHLNNLRYLPMSKLGDPNSALKPTLVAEVNSALDDPAEGVSQWLSRHL